MICLIMSTVCKIIHQLGLDWFSKVVKLTVQNLGVLHPQIDGCLRAWTMY
jgi:hypothetical protein